MIALALALALAAGPQEVRIAGPQGWQLAGTLVSPEKPTGQAVLLLHALGASNREWFKLVPELTAKGITVLAIDLPGHGASLMKAGKPVTFKKFGRADWLALPDAAEAALRFLAKQPDVDGKRLGVAGSSIGANGAALAAAKDGDVKALVPLSPGVDYKGLMPGKALAAFAPRPALIYAARDDPQAGPAAARLAGKLASVKPKVFDGGGHGTALFVAHPELPAEVAAFFAQNL